MDVVDLFLLLIRYTPLFVLAVLTCILIYLQIREAKNKQHYTWHGTRRKAARH